MLLKKYLDNYIVDKSDSKPIIMIIYNKDIFLINNRYQKYRLLIVKIFHILKKNRL